jgi:hypothetical protein
LFASVCAGLGLFLIGAVNLVWLRKSMLLRVLGSAAGIAVALGAAWAIDHPGTIGRAAILFVVGLTPFLCLSRHAMRVFSAAFGSLQRPPIRFGLLTVMGIGTIIGALIVNERLDQIAADESMSELSQLDSSTPSVPTVRATAKTDLGTPIVLKEPAVNREEVLLSAAENKILNSASLQYQTIRREGGGDHSNCHGWVFACGKFRLSPDDVELILRENHYEEVHEPQSGDVVIYRKDGVIQHSAIVRYVTEGQPILVEGKWGAFGVLLHPAEKSLYGDDYTFYRSSRKGHTLLGLGDVPHSTATRISPTTE